MSRLREVLLVGINSIQPTTSESPPVEIGRHGTLHRPCQFSLHDVTIGILAANRELSRLEVPIWTEPSTYGFDTSVPMAKINPSPRDVAYRKALSEYKAKKHELESRLEKLVMKLM